MKEFLQKTQRKGLKRVPLSKRSKNGKNFPEYGKTSKNFLSVWIGLWLSLSFGAHAYFTLDTSFGGGEREPLLQRVSQDVQVDPRAKSLSCYDPLSGNTRILFSDLKAINLLQMDQNSGGGNFYWVVSTGMKTCVFPYSLKILPYFEALPRFRYSNALIPSQRERRIIPIGQRDRMIPVWKKKI